MIEDEAGYPGNLVLVTVLLANNVYFKYGTFYCLRSSIRYQEAEGMKSDKVSRMIEESLDK